MLLTKLSAVPFHERDAWVDSALGFGEPPADAQLPPGAVPYLPCGVEEIVAMARELPLKADDVLVDLGSGVGRVAIVAHLLTGARTHGIELQPHLVEQARERAEALGLSPHVTFEHGDAREARLEGDVFFLYAPFNGEMLTSVLARLEALAKTKRIAICAAGLELDVPWLTARKTSCASLTLYSSRGC